jgi:hypothetical protein
MRLSEIRDASQHSTTHERRKPQRYSQPYDFCGYSHPQVAALNLPLKAQEFQSPRVQVSSRELKPPHDGRVQFDRDVGRLDHRPLLGDSRFLPGTERLRCQPD